MNAVVKSEDSPGKWELQELKPWHKQFCSMLAQGIDRQTIATVLEITPEYVSMLSRQPLIQAYIREMCQFASLQLEAQFAQGVQVIGDVMANGAPKERLQAVRLNAELTHRIGAGAGTNTEPVDTNERLLRLSERLLGLLEKGKASEQPIIQGECHEVVDAETL